MPRSTANKLEPLTVRLSQAEHDYLEQEALENGWSKAEAIRFCIRISKEFKSRMSTPSEHQETCK